MKAGIVFADKVTTVSPSYAKEIATPEGGARLDGVIRARGRDVVGISNGIDFAVWNPATDPHLVARYDAEDPGAKARCKADLQAQLGLAVRPDAPVFGVVARLDPQKGLDLLVEAAPRIMRQDAQLVVLGEGDAALADALVHLAERFPERVAFRRAFDEPLAHKIYAGADFFLAPSRSEPAGLTHLYAMRYGAIPVVRATGGMRDTVLDCDPAMETGTGIVFDRPDAEEFYGAIARALSAWRQREGLARLRHRVMRRDFSWDRSARQYQSLYAALAAGTTGE
jgi:starch synthase